MVDSCNKWAKSPVRFDSSGQGYASIKPLHCFISTGIFCLYLAGFIISTVHCYSRRVNLQGLIFLKSPSCIPIPELIIGNWFQSLQLSLPISKTESFNWRHLNFEAYEQARRKLPLRLNQRSGRLDVNLWNWPLMRTFSAQFCLCQLPLLRPNPITVNRCLWVHWQLIWMRFSSRL